MTALLDSAPLGPVHYRLWILSTAGTLLSGASMVALGAGLPLLIPQFHLSPALVGLAGATLMGGTVLGALVEGRLADRFGRRPVLIGNMVWLLFSALLVALAPSAPVLVVGELLLGMGIGGDFPVGSSYISEFMPQNHRGRMMAASIALQPAGMVLTAGLALELLARTSPLPEPWRWLMAFQAVLVLPYIVARWRMPESVRWLMARGKNREAAEILGRFVPEKRLLLRRMASELGSHRHHVSRLPQERTRHWTAIFSRAYRRRTLLVTLPWFLMDIATYGVGLFTTLLLGAIHPGKGTHRLLGWDWENTLHSGVADLFLLAGALGALWLVPRFGRIQMQVWGFWGMCIGMLVLWLGNAGNWTVAAILGAFGAYNISMTLGPNATTFILPAEMYPTEVRAFGAGFAAAAAKMGATLSVFALPLLQNAAGVGTVLLAMVLVSAAGAILTYTFRVEGHGLTLEEHHGALSLLGRHRPESREDGAAKPSGGRKEES